MKDTLTQLPRKTTTIKAMFYLLGKILMTEMACSISSGLIVKWSNILLCSLLSHLLYALLPLTDSFIWSVTLLLEVKQ